MILMHLQCKQLLDKDKLLEQIQGNLARAQQRMKHRADKKRRDLNLEIGDQVLVKLQPYRQHSAAIRKNQKLEMRFFGPFSVIGKIGSVAYKLKLPESIRIHPVFHVSQLKLFKGPATIPYQPLPLVTTELGPMIHPKSVLGTRTIKKGHQVQQVFIQWDNSELAKASWEDIEEIKLSYPTFNVENKVPFIGEGNVMTNMLEQFLIYRERMRRFSVREFTEKEERMINRICEKD